MSKTKTTIELWACIDSNGDYATGEDAEKARERYEENVGAVSEAEGFRLVKVSVLVSLPEPVELTGEASDEETASLTSVS